MARDSLGVEGKLVRYRLKADVTFEADDKKRALEKLGRYFAHAADSDMATALDLLDRPDGAIDICLGLSELEPRSR